MDKNNLCWETTRAAEATVPKVGEIGEGGGGIAKYPT